MNKNKSAGDRKSRRAGISTGQIVGIALFAALSFVAMLFLRFPVPPFLTLDFKDAVITLGAILYGSPVGPLLALIVGLIEFLTVSSTGLWGFLMNFSGSAVFSFCLSLSVRKSRESRSLALFSALSVATTTAVMLLLNLLVTPRYYGVDVRAVIAMMPTVFLPFNLAKGLLNALAVMLLTPPVCKAARSMKVADPICPGVVGFSENAKLFALCAGGVALAAFGLLLLLFLA